jgi:hypothetical protein
MIHCPRGAQSKGPKSNRAKSEGAGSTVDKTAAAELSTASIGYRAGGDLRRQ